jgi:Ca2+-binding RTX toxin-like protein
MANLTTTFTSWSALENLIAAGDVYADSPAYDAELANLENLTYELFSYPSTAFSGSDSYAYASGYYRNVELWGGGFSTDNWLITQARIDNTSNASSLLLQGSVRFDAYGNPYGSLTYLSYLHGGFGQWERGSVPLQGGIATLTSWGATLPTALGSLTYEHKGLSSTNLTTGFTTETYTATTVMDGSGHRADLTGFSLTLTDTDASTVSFLHTILAGNDSITGAAGSQELRGFSGNDTLDGLSGADSMLGGAGNDTFIVDDAGDTVVELANEGLDTVKSTVSWSLATTTEVENVVLTGSANAQATGNAAANVLTGNAGNNRLDGGFGNDTMIGGLGNDAFVVDNPGDVVTEAAGGGTDVIESSISLSLVPTPNIENLTLTGAAANGTGNALNNILTGNAQANTLDGGAGIDTLIGGSGDDTYVVDVAGDVISEAAGEGTDQANVAYAVAGTYVLSGELENAVVISGAAIAVNLTGNAASNMLTGNAAANILNGGTGADTLIGGFGNDTYVVDNAGDVVAETSALASEIDLVQSSVDFTLGDNLENLTLTGAAAMGAGNALNNLITGTVGNNTLDGGAGADTLIGGFGNDFYLVDLKTVGTGAGTTAALEDAVAEVAAAGTDTLILRGSASNSVATTLALAAELENFDASGTGSTLLNLTGNAVANLLTGNAAANILDGGLGADTLLGGGGDDIYVVDSLSDVVTELAAEGVDLVKVNAVTAGGTYSLGNELENATLINAVAYNLTGNSLSNSLIGNLAANSVNGGDGNDTLDGGAGNDTLVGGAGDDIMIGGSGDDVYVIDAAGDLIVEAAAGGTDRVSTGLGSYALEAEIENLTYTGSGDFSGTGNAAANSIVGSVGNDTLIGGIGSDSLVGGSGDDQYLLDIASDVISENFGEGLDLVKLGFTSTASYTLTISVENAMIVDGGAVAPVAVHIVGNDLNNQLTGNAAANSLSGLWGNDTLIGDGGNDTLDGGIGNDTAVLAGVLADYTVSRVSATATAFVAGGSTVLLRGIEQVQFLGDASTVGLAGLIAGLSSPESDTLNGSSGADTLDGLAGNDLLNGGAGNDTLDGGAGSDTYQYFAGGGNDRIVQNDTATGAVDTLLLGSLIGDLASGETVLTRGGAGHNDLVISISTGLPGLDATGRVTVEGFFSGDQIDAGTLDQIRFASNGSVINQSQILAELIKGTFGNDWLRGYATNDSIAGGAGNDTMSGAAGNDTLNGGRGMDQLYGDAGFDFLDGGSSRDQLDAGDGDDTLNGGTGRDTLTGGAGNDRFVFGTPEVFLQNDLITDFVSGGDRIALSVSVFGGLGMVGASLGLSANLTYDNSTGALAYDADGAGGNAGITFATLGSGAHPATLGMDFIMVA